jgi:hypothetical protein
MSNTNSRVPHNPGTEGWLTRRQVAEQLGKSNTTVRRMELTGKLNPVVVGEVHLFDPKEVRALKPQIPAPVVPAPGVAVLDTPAKVSAACFGLFERGHYVTEVVRLLGLAPGVVRALYKQWEARATVPPASTPDPEPVLDDREQEGLEGKWRDEMDRTYSAWEKDLDAKWHPKSRSK